MKGLLFAQGVSGYQPLRKDRRQRLEELQTGDGRELPKYQKAQINRELDSPHTMTTHLYNLPTDDVEDLGPKAVFEENQIVGFLWARALTSGKGAPE